MLNCLFWNFRCGYPDCESVAARVAAHHRVDILALTDTIVDPLRLLAEWKRFDKAYERPDIDHPRFQLFTRFPGQYFTRFRADNRISVNRVRMPGRREILFGVIHFFDRRNNDRDTQHSKSRSVYGTLYSAEEDAGHARTVLVGDFNMNPFDKGMIDPEGFGAMMSRSLVIRHSSKVAGGIRRFYNPMWSRLGRELPEPPGSYYGNNSGDPFNIFWHSLDQVLIRPALFDSFRDEDFRLLTSIPWGQNETLDLIRSRDTHWEVRVSDHLPILFTLDLPVESDHG